jgi:hypothetical protein
MPPKPSNSLVYDYDMWDFIVKNHLFVFISLTALFLLLWNLDRYFPICPYGTIPLIIGIILEIVIAVRKAKSPRK